MTIARSTGAFVGTDETTGVSIAAGATSTGNQVDLLGGTDSVGTVDIYFVFTGATAKGSIYVHFDRARVTGVPSRVHTYKIQTEGASGLKLYLGRHPVGRYARGVVENKTAYALTNVAVLYELEKTT